MTLTPEQRREAEAAQKRLEELRRTLPIDQDLDEMQPLVRKKKPCEADVERLIERVHGKQRKTA